MMRAAIRWLLGVDVGELTGGADWRLGFVGEYSNYVVLGLLLVAAALIALTVRSYRREGNAPRRAKACGAGLRIAVICLLLACIFRPAVILRTVRTLYSSVLILVDDSLSMSFQDAYATPDARRHAARLAEALSVDAAGLGRLSRSRIAQKVLADPNGPMARLAQDHPLIFMAYGTSEPGTRRYTRDLATVDRATADRDAASDPGAAETIASMLGGLVAEGYETNHSAALWDAMERTRGRRLEGIVLIGDGQTTAREGNGRLRSALQRAAERAPIYALVVGDPTPLKNVAVTSLGAPREARRGARVEFTAWIAWRNLSGQAVTVDLERRDAAGKWAPTGAKASLVLNAPAPADSKAPARGLQKVTLHTQPKELGQFSYRAIVRALPGEKSTDDNAAEALVRVADEKVKILLVSGGSGWEFRFLRDYLLSQPELYRVSVWQQTNDSGLDQAGSKGMKISRLPRALPDLLGVAGDKSKPGYDVVILCDPQFTEGGFDPEFVNKLLTPFVAEHGGGLCYIVGNKYTETNLLASGAFTSLADMLPVSLSINSVSRMIEEIERRVSVPWPVRLTTYGLDHPAMRLGADSQESAEIWGSFPGIFWSHPVRRSKPAARVLAESSNPAYRTDDGEPLPAIAVQPFGRGRVLYLGFNSTWRWRYIRDAFYYRQFWGDAMRYLATLKARRVVITTGGDWFEVGKDIPLDVTAYDEGFEPETAETFDIEMIDAETRDAKTLTLKAVPDRPGRYKLTIKAPQKGAYQFTAMRNHPDADELVAGKRIVVELPQAEAKHPEADEATMKTIASRPENFLRVADAGRLADLIPHGRRPSVNEVHRELWDSRLMLLLAIALLAIEWILRKKYNMA